MSDQDWTTELREFATLKPRKSLAQEAADTLREFILLGKLSAGQAVPERELAQAFGISRTPLKEALRMLETEGLIVYSATRRPSVADPSLRQINEWLRVQGALEALAGELACEVATDTEIAEIEKANLAIGQQPGCDDPLESFKRDMTFHTAIVEAARNTSLAETHASYNARLWRVRFLSSQRTSGREATIREHRNIIEALKARKPRSARIALRQHLRTAETNIAAALAERSSLST
ncbi:MAG: GntR family transcriptional regulator [Pseudomonadota bacterium]